MNSSIDLKRIHEEVEEIHDKARKDLDSFVGKGVESLKDKYYAYFKSIGFEKALALDCAKEQVNNELNHFGEMNFKGKEKND